MATTVGEIQLIARINTAQYQQDAKSIEKANDGIEKSADSTSKKSNAAFSTIAKVGLAAVATAAVAVGVAITKNIGGAIRRVDTLNNSTRTFENMGFATAEVESNMQQLVESITGLPTPLDSAVRGMQSLAATYGDIGQGRAIFTALNNAILGFGGTAQEVDNAITQLSQLPMDGPLDAQTWNSLRNSGLTPVLVAMAKDMGMGVNEMKKAFGEGELTVKDFTEALVNMDKQGGGGMKSLEKIARDSTKGIDTGWANMQTAIQRGVANIITAIGPENLSGAITTLGKVLESGLNAFVRLVEFVQRNSKVFQTLAILIGSVLTPFIISYTAATIAAGVQSLIAGARMAAGWLLALGPIGIIVAAVTAAVALIIANWDTVKGWLSSFWNWIKKNWDIVLGVLTGGVGLAVVAIIRNFDKIKSIAGTVMGWFKDIGAAIGNALGNAFKTAVNAVLGFLENRINDIIDTMNHAIHLVDNITPGGLDRIDRVSLPRLAEGGIITSPTIAMVGEGGEAEAVIPLSKLDKMLDNKREDRPYEPRAVVRIPEQSSAEYRQGAVNTIKAYNEYLRSRGLPELGVA